MFVRKRPSLEDRKKRKSDWNWICNIVLLESKPSCF